MQDSLPIEVFFSTENLTCSLLVSANSRLHFPCMITYTVCYVLFLKFKVSFQEVKLTQTSQHDNKSKDHVSRHRTHLLAPPGRTVSQENDPNHYILHPQAVRSLHLRNEVKLWMLFYKGYDGD